MPQPSSSHPAPKKRVVTVDGLRYSLETGHQVGRGVRPPALSPRPKPGASQGHVVLGERPLPKAVELNDRRQAVMHPNHDRVMAEIMHPEPVIEPTRLTRTHRRSFFRQVVVHSFHRPHDRRATNAVLLATILSPGYWLLLALPWIISSWFFVINQPTTRWYGYLYAFIQELSFIKLAIGTVVLVAGLTVVWMVRHALLLMNYTLNLRHIDHRQVHSQQVWRQSLSKIGKFASVAVVDSLLSATLLVVSMLSIVSISRSQVGFAAWQSLTINAVLLLTAILLVFMAIHRPLGRVMLAATNQPLSFIVARSYGLIQRSRGLAILAGLVWVLVAGLTAATLAGVVLATINYGFYGIAQTWLARAGLAVGSAVLLYVLVALFAIWSQHYWALSYHHLAHRFYKARVSELFVTEAKPQSRAKVLLPAAIVLCSLIVFTIGVLALARPGISSVIDQAQSKLPAKLQDLLLKRSL